MPKLPPVRLSPTSLERWYSLGCPAAWNFSRQWTPAKESYPLALGNAVHALMAGEKTEAETENKTAVAIWKKLVIVKGAMNLTVRFDPQGRALVERKHEWHIRPKVVFVTKLDFIGTDERGQDVIVDWKASLGYGWKFTYNEKGELFAPQVRKPQSPGYLYPRPQEILDAYGLTSWPKRMYYLVGPIRGAVQIHECLWSQDAQTNFDQALDHAARVIQTNHFPKIYGHHCHECDYQGPCFGPGGWQAAYHPPRPGKDAPADLAGQ